MMIVVEITKVLGGGCMNINKKGSTECVEFRSLDEFYNYITQTPFNSSFECANKSSIDSDYYFTKTNSFEEAVDIMHHGWSDMSDKLTQRLKTDSGNMEKVMVSKNTISVQGYQPVVPLFLNNVPANMMSRKLQPMKQKVITINKSIAYSAIVTVERIIEESIKALRIIKKLENQNYRCNLNVIVGTEAGGERYCIKIRIKSANERLNINKLSFPLVHPSMLRRLFFRFIEVHPGVSRSFVWGYGRPLQPEDYRRVYSDEILLPQFINKDVDKIKSLEDLEKLANT